MGDDIRIGDEYKGSDDKWIIIDNEFLGLITAIGMRSYIGDPKVRREYENI